jgi:hypothetical protein
VEGNHFVTALLQGLPRCLCPWCNKPEEGQGNSLPVLIRLPAASDHSADAGCSFIQYAAGNAVNAQQIGDAVEHGNIFGADG